MGHNFINDILNALQRVATLDTERLREVLIISGMPEATQNLRYMGYNRQIVEEENRTLEFSAVAVINNRRAQKWQLRGYQKKVSRVVFSAKWTRNPLDLFLNNLRCHPDMMALLKSSKASYTLLGLLQTEKVIGRGFFKQRLHFVQPVVAIPGLNERTQTTVAAFEAANEIRKTRVWGLPFYRKIGRQMASR
ncbi:hypothetical protein ACFL5W_00150 [Thermodesulfobacteriota bacterium]